ncbi:transposase [Streptomyces yangpuensis]|uniref:helix-turn-helix domain-containing protein n=1 Tax=Streptomyces yangpuensis TaxID=1648182 RepID=UPI0036A96A76
MQAVELFEQKVKLPAVAGRLRVNWKSAYQWHQLWRDGGVRALTSQGLSGSGCQLSQRCLEKLAVYLEQGPVAHGWVEEHVGTAARVATLIGRKFHVCYSVSGIARLRPQLGYSPLVPVRRVTGRDDQAVAVWKEATSAEVKEPGRPAAAFKDEASFAPEGTQRTHLGPVPTHPGRDVQRATLQAPVGGRTDRNAARITHPTVPPPAHPPRRQGQADRPA